MMPYWQELPLQCVSTSLLPQPVCLLIDALARKTAICASTPEIQREVVVTIRGRPVDRRGRAGCHVEIWSDGPPPPGGLKAVRWAGGDLLQTLSQPPKSNRFAAQPAAVSCTLGLDLGTLGGWKVTLDLCWPKEGWSI